MEELKGLLLKNEDDMEAARVEAERRRHQVELDKSSLQVCPASCLMRSVKKGQPGCRSRSQEASHATAP